jgi:hypothetical protein
MPLDWEGLKTAYYDSERRRLGLPSRAEVEAKRAEETRAAAESASGLETAALQRTKLQGDIETQPELTRLRSETALAQAEAARARAGQQPQLTGDAYLASLPPDQLAEFVRRKGMVAEATRDPNTGGIGSPVQITQSGGAPGLFFPPKQQGVVSLPEGASFATDVRKARGEAVAATQPLTTVETLADQVESALTRFDSTSWVNPIDKAVAQNQYRSLLNALAVPWGRLLGDTRISNEDRQSYAQSVGVPSIFLKDIAPDEAKTRLMNLRVVIDQIRQKYGPVLESSSGMLEAVGGGANLLGGQPPGGAPPATVAPNSTLPPETTSALDRLFGPRQ